MAKSRIFKIKGRPTWIAGLGSLAAIGGWLLVREINGIDRALNEALPINVMIGRHRSAVYIYIPDNLTGANEAGLPWQEFVPMSSTTPWKLVSMARSKDRAHRLLGLKLLASMQNLTAASCCQVAQTSDFRMAIGLARSSSADLRMLRPPPPLPSDLTQGDVWQDFFTLLRLLPQSDEHKCVQYATSLALQNGYAVKDDFDDSIVWSTEESHSTKPLLRKPSENVLGSIILEALLCHSAVPEHRSEIVHHKGLQIIWKFCKARPRDENHRCLVAQILGNLALDERLHGSIYQAGWVRILAKWSRHPNLEVAFPAVRALANLDKENVKVAFGNGIYLASPQHWDNQVKVLGDVVFVHGLLGGAFKTWRQMDSNATEAPGPQPYTRCWPKDWLAHDCPHLRVILVDFDTHLTEWGRACPYETEKRTLEERSAELLRKLQLAGVGERPIVWVAHSMGGLMVKQMLLQSQSSPDTSGQKVCENTRGITFYSVPHHGSSLAKFNFGSRYLLLPSAELRELQQDSQKLKALHEAFVQFLQSRNMPCLSFCENRKTTVGSLRITATFVTPESADLGFGEFYKIDTDHMYICKPFSRDSPIYSNLADFVRRQIGHTALEAMQHPMDGRNHVLEFIISASFT